VIRITVLLFFFLNSAYSAAEFGKFELSISYSVSYYTVASIRECISVVDPGFVFVGHDPLKISRKGQSICFDPSP